MKKIFSGKKILIFGGKKILGANLVKEFSSDNKVFCVSRTCFSKKIPNVEFLRGDINDLNFLLSLNKRHYDVLIDNLAFDQDHIQRIHNALKNNVSKYILTSSSWVYKFVKDKPPFADIKYEINELSFPADTLPITVEYITGKIKAELRATKLWNQCIITRIPMMFGKNDPTNRLKFIVKRVLDNNDVILLNKGRNKFQVAYAPDMARLYKSLILIEQQVPLWINLANPEIYTAKNFYALCAYFLKNSKLRFINATEEEAKKLAYDYWEAEPFWREKKHLLNCGKLHKLIKNIQFTKNKDWIKELCCYEKNEIKKNTKKYSRFSSELSFINSHQNNIT